VHPPAAEASPSLCGPWARGPPGLGSRSTRRRRALRRRRRAWATRSTEEEPKGEDEEEGDGEEGEELEEVAMNEKAVDPLWRAIVKRNVEGDDYLCKVVDIERSVRTSEKLYLVEYCDGDIEHLTKDQVLDGRLHPLYDEGVAVCIYEAAYKKAFKLLHLSLEGAITALVEGCEREINTQADFERELAIASYACERTGLWFRGDAEEEQGVDED